MTTELSPTVATGIVVVKTGILLFGGLITYFSMKAYRRTGAPALRALTIGFGIITLGGLLGGIVDQVLRIPFGVGILLDASLTLLGFIVITYSMYAD
jgi:energy-converting hydrogenase Eha subunit F